MTPALPVTAVIPVKNEEANLGRCLERLERFAEIVVIDSSSTDRTVEIARAHGARVINFVWNGAYPKKRNWFLLNHATDTPWVLFLDADELVDSDFCREVEKAISNGEFCGFWLNYTNHFMGTRLRHGVKQRKLALFRVGAGLYERIDEDGWTELDMEVHEHPIVQGRVGEIAAPIEHHADHGHERLIDRHRAYASWEACRIRALRRAKATRIPDHMTRRQALKYRYVDSWWFPIGYFLYSYVARLGFLDGRAGYHYALLKFWYFNSMRMFVLEQRKSDDANDRAR